MFFTSVPWLPRFSVLESVAVEYALALAPYSTVCVFLPAMPSAVSPLEDWKVISAVSVAEPNTPSALPREIPQILQALLQVLHVRALAAQAQRRIADLARLVAHRAASGPAARAGGGRRVQHRQRLRARHAVRAQVLILLGTAARASFVRRP